MPNNKTNVIEQTKNQDQVKKPRKYNVLIHNDDFTTFNFVEEVLMKVFRKTKQEAEAVAFNVHKSKYGIAGCFTHEIAETKIYQADTMIASSDHSLLLTMEPE